MFQANINKNKNLLSPKLRLNTLYSSSLSLSHIAFKPQPKYSWSLSITDPLIELELTTITTNGDGDATRTGHPLMSSCKPKDCSIKPLIPCFVFCFYLVLFKTPNG